MSDEIYNISDLNHTFQQDSTQVEIFKNISLKVYDQDFIFILGPSGSGKSTFMNFLAGIEKPSTGKIVFKGKMNLATMKKDELCNYRFNELGFIFQFPNLVNSMTVYENIELPLFHRTTKKIDRNRTVEDFLELLGIKERKDFLPKQLSAGEKQRVAIARSLVNNPSVILADEPTGNLDSQTAHKIMNYFKILHDQMKKTIIIATHDLDLLLKEARIFTIENQAFKPFS